MSESGGNAIRVDSVVVVVGITVVVDISEIRRVADIR